MTIDFKLPELGENVTSGDIVNILVRQGQQIAANDGVIELETEKAVVEIPCPHAGTINKIQVKKGDTVQVGQTLLTLEAEAEAPTRPRPAAAPEAETATTGRAATRPHPGPLPKAEGGEERVVPAGPAARRLARELGVDLGQVRPGGPHGRITVEDVQAAAESLAAGPPTAAEAAEFREQDAWGPVRRERMPRIRRTIAEQMTRSAAAIPHVTNFDDADITELENLRAGVPAGYLGENVRLTLMPWVVKAVALSLPRHPTLNASLDMEKEEVVYKQYVNVGVAVDTPRGLVVPVLRQADRLSVAQLAEALAAVAQRARATQFTLDELRGGTFTVSNLGAVGGGAYSTPIINYPEVAVLLVGRARRMPMVRGEQHDKIEIRLMLPLSLSYDHRLIDGAAAGRFLNEVIACLQSPAKLLL